MFDRSSKSFLFLIHRSGWYRFLILSCSIFCYQDSHKTAVGDRTSLASHCLPVCINEPWRHLTTVTAQRRASEILLSYCCVQLKRRKVWGFVTICWSWSPVRKFVVLSPVCVERDTPRSWLSLATVVRSGLHDSKSVIWTRKRLLFISAYYPLGCNCPPLSKSRFPPSSVYYNHHFLMNTRDQVVPQIILALIL